MQIRNIPDLIRGLKNDHLIRISRGLSLLFQSKTAEVWSTSRLLDIKKFKKSKEERLLWAELLRLFG
jgi:hypothetical protein